MAYENPTSDIETQCLNSDIISILPQNIIESILSLMPIRDALRTSVLSKKWQYCWQGMPKLVFTDTMVKLPSTSGCKEFNKYKLATAIFHVLLLHNGPEILEFDSSVGDLHMDSEFASILSYLARGNKLKQLTFMNDDDNSMYKLPVSFFSLQGLELIDINNCTFEPPLTFNGFTQLQTITFRNVEVSAQTLHQLLSNCPLLQHFCLSGDQTCIYFVAGGNYKFTFIDLLQCVPLIQSLHISEYYIQDLCPGGMPRRLPTSLVHLKDLYLDGSDMSPALCIIRSSPVLERIILHSFDYESLYDQENSTSFLDPEDQKLDHLEILEMRMFNNYSLQMGFVKLIMANSPVLKKVRVVLDDVVSVDEEVKMLRDMVLHPFPRASPSAKLIIERR